MFATVGSENYMKLKFPRLADNSTNDSLHAFGALRTFRAGWLWCSCCCAEQERCHATNTLPRKVPWPIAILLTTLLFVALGPFLWLPMEKAFICRRIASTLLAKILSTFSCCKSCMKQFPSTSEKDEWQGITGWKSYKMALGKRQSTLSSWQDRCSTKWLWCFFEILFIRSWMHWFDHFLTKLSKFLTGNTICRQLTGNTIV